MTNEEKINLIGQKMLVLSSNLEKYQAELQLLKIQLLQLQQQNLAFQKHTPPPISQTPVPKIEIVPEIKTMPVEVKQDPITVVPPVDKIEPVENPLTQSTPNKVHQQNPSFQFRFKDPIFSPPAPKKKNELWEKIEKQFAENWTGILGSIILVIGVGFLGIYAALKVSAMGRFMLISGFAAVLGGVFFSLRKKEDWLKLALWLRSSAGAIFLFACVGANGIPGLKFTDNETAGLLLLFVGIAVNLFLGYIGGKQSFASLHVLLTLVSVGIMPLSALSLIVGGIITLFGVALTYREKWDYHLLFTISSFFVFHLFYWNSLHNAISQQERITGIIAILVIGLAVALVHYRKVYTTKQFEGAPFTVHLVNWFYFGLGLYLYSNGSRNSTFFLAAGSIAAFVLARKAKKLEIRWLYLTDTLIAQLTALIALATLNHWKVDGVVIMAAIFAEGLLFLFISQKEKDELLYKVGTVTLNLIGLSLLIDSLATIDYSSQSLIIIHAITVLSTAVLGLGYLIYSNKNTMNVSGLFRPFNIFINEKTKHPVLAILLAGLFLSYYLQVYHFTWSIYAVAALLIVLLFLRNKQQSIELFFASAIVLFGVHIINWCQLYAHQSQGPVLMISFGLPILAASFLSTRWSFSAQFSKHFNWPGIYLIAIQLTLLSYYLLYPVSILAPGGIWLILSAVAITTAKIMSKSLIDFHRAERSVLHSGYLLVGLFLIRDMAYHFSTAELWGPLKGRIWIDLLAISIFAYWGITKKQEPSNYKSWKYLHPLFLELILLFSVINTATELKYSYLPLVWISTATVSFILAGWKHEGLGRLHVYSFGLFILAIFHQVILYKSTMNYVGRPLTYLDQPFQLACIFSVLAFSYLLFFYKRAVLSTINWPHLLQFMKPFTEAFYKRAAFIGVYLFAAFLLLISYFMFAPVSSIVPGVVWLLLSIIAVTLSFQKQSSNFIEVDRYLLHIGYLFIGSFLVRHLLVHIQLEGYVGPFKIRFLIELLALAVFVYWATLKPKIIKYKSWKLLHPLFIELIFLFTVFVIALEVNAIWQPLIWMIVAFVLAIVGNNKQWSLSRLVFYSLIMYWIAAFQTTFVTSSYIVPSTEMLNQPWVYGTASVLFQFIFLAYFYLKCSLENIELPRSLLFLNRTITLINTKRNVYVFYPLIICTAVFLYWSYDSSILTLLWVLECAIVFIISILLKEQHFRYIALGSLAICIIRLVFYDMVQASTLNRALVFLGVGVIMLGMNSLYNKYKTRF